VIAIYNITKEKMTKVIIVFNILVHVF